jgi:hypothetical protein
MSELEQFVVRVHSASAESSTTEHLGTGVRVGHGHVLTCNYLLDGLEDGARLFIDVPGGVVHNCNFVHNCPDRDLALLRIVAGDEEAQIHSPSLGTLPPISDQHRDLPIFTYGFARQDRWT